MPIASTDIQFRLSGGATNTNPNASLGGVMSGTAISGTALNNLFDDVTGDENAALDVEYRCFYVRNAHASLTLQSAVIWLSAEVAGGANGALGIGSAAIGDGATTGVEQTVANENTAPTGVTFSAPTTKGTALLIGNLGAGQAKSIWVRRTATNSAALNNDGLTWRVEGDTAA